MLRQVLSASAAVVLLAGVAACGGGDDGDGAGTASTTPPGGEASASSGSTPPSTPSTILDDPSGLWDKSPGQGDKVKTRLTSAGFGCTQMPTQYAVYHACSKGRAGGMVWFKYVTSGDGTVLFAKASSFEDVKPVITAVVGADDANVLFAGGTVIRWGYAGSDWVMINRLDDRPEPPVPVPYENTRASMLAAYANSNLRCEADDPRPSETPSASAPSEKSTMHCIQRAVTPDARTELNLAFVSDQLTEISLVTDYDRAASAKPFADAKAAALKTLNRLWPVLKGSDPQPVKEFVEAHLIPAGSAIGYVDYRKVRVDESSTGKVTIRIGPERPGLAEPKS